MASPNPTPPHPRPISIKVAARKLPIKRKTPDSDSPNPKPNPNLNPNFSPLPFPKIETHGDIEDEDLEPEDDLQPPPFKFHRIWSESDEIRFLRGLLDCSGGGLTFPRDLHIFYERFSLSMPQPYTKSQLSEKLRRLRKKFRVISARLARGLDASLLSQHDRSLFDLSKQLWHPDFSSSSPFHANNNKKSSTSKVNVKASFSPNLYPSSSDPAPVSLLPHSSLNNNVSDHVDGDDIEEDVETNELNFESNLDDAATGSQEEKPNLGGGDGSRGTGLGRIAANTVMDVFDKSLKEVQMALVRRGLLFPDQKPAMIGSSKQGKETDFTKRWREQRVTELDVLARRLRLVLENAVYEH